MVKILKNYTQQIEVNASTENVFNALNNGLNLWWGKISHAKFEINRQFTITFENGYWWTFKILEYNPNNTLIWKCIDGEPEFNKEWIGHLLHWEIIKKDASTTVKFKQTGLTPELHCYDVCSSTWDMFITQKLKEHLS